MGHRFASLVLAGFLATALIPGGANAQSNGDASSSRWGVGFQSSFPAYGLSAVYDLSEPITLQGVLGAFGVLNTFSARVLYRFQRERAYDLYGFGTAGIWRYSTSLYNETPVGVGGGAGIELDWRSLFSPDDGSFPPLFSSIDLGFTAVSFDHYNFNGLSIGAGLHYRF